MAQMNFMAENDRLQKLSQIGDPLEKLNKYMDWRVFETAINCVFEATTVKVGVRRLTF